MHKLISQNLADSAISSKAYTITMLSEISWIKKHIRRLTDNLEAYHLTV